MNDIINPTGNNTLRKKEQQSNLYCCINKQYLFHDITELCNFSDYDDDFNEE